TFLGDDGLCERGVGGDSEEGQQHRNGELLSANHREICHGIRSLVHRVVTATARCGTRYIREWIENASWGEKFFAAGGATLRMGPAGVDPHVQGNGEGHVVRRLGDALGGGVERWGYGRRPAALGALSPATDIPSAAEATHRSPPRSRRRGRGPERFSQFLPRNRSRPFPTIE